MSIRNVLLDIANNYLSQKNSVFAKNVFAKEIRNGHLNPFKTLLKNYRDRYIVCGSPGRGHWADCPWIGIFDSIKTESAQDGYYLVYLFDKNTNGVYLSLNQGVTAVKNEYRGEAKKVLAARAEDFRCKLDFLPVDKIDITLNSQLPNPKLYEKGNILATYYNANNIPDESTLEADFERFLKYYQDLVAIDSSDINYENCAVEEIKKRRLHEKFDRRGNIALAVKKKKGVACEACGLSFIDKYGALGKEYIEAHHLIPFSTLAEGKTRLDLKKDFAVLCSNCHRMIHRLKDSSNLEELKAIVDKYKK